MLSSKCFENIEQIVVFLAYFTEDLRTDLCREGEIATMYCRLIEENNSIRWFKDGHEIKCETDRYRIDIEGRQHRLTIPVVDEEDKGEYSVHVNNCKRKIFLNVEGTFLFSMKF